MHGGGQREEPVKKYRGLGARNGLTAVHRNGRHGVFYGVGRESAVKQRRERYFRERERGVVHGERDTSGALHGVRGLSGGQRIRATEKAVFTAHIPRGIHRRGSGLRRRFSGCFRYGRRRDRRRSGRAEKADAGIEERERREQHDSKHRARDDEPDGLFPIFHRFFCFVYLGHGMPPKRKCAGDSVQRIGIRMSGARSAAQKSLAEVAPAGAKKFKTFLPAACTLVKLLPGSQTCEQSECAAARCCPRQTRAMQRKALVCVFTVDGRRAPCKGSPFLHPKFRIVPRRCARSR